MDHMIERYDGCIASMEDGVPAADLLRRRTGPTDRSILCDALKGFETQRYAWRLSLMRACLAKGMTITEFAELFGFSRQYAQKLARELRG